MDRLKIAVTGASGLVGLHAVRYLAAAGHSVVAVVRGQSRTEQLAAVPGVSVSRAEITDGAALAAAFTGVDVVLHAAGTVDPLGERAAIRRVNVEGTRTCLDAAVDAHVRQFIHVSSLSVITAQGDQFDVDESAPTRYCGEAYADSKVDAERLVMAESEGLRIQVTVLRPGFIYGPGERAWMPRLINSLKQGKAMLIDGGLRETNVIYVENLCRALALSLMNERAFGRVFNLTDGEKVSKKELFDAIADGLSLPRATKKVPRAVAQPFCEFVSTVAPLLPKETQRELARFSRAAFRLAGINQGFSIGLAERELGYTDRVAFAEGMRLTLAEFKAAGSGAEKQEARTR